VGSGAVGLPQGTDTATFRVIQQSGVWSRQPELVLGWGNDEMHPAATLRVVVPGTEEHPWSKVRRPHACLVHVPCPPTLSNHDGLPTSQPTHLLSYYSIFGSRGGRCHAHTHTW
jgi:hypothetical protein